MIFYAMFWVWFLWKLATGLAGWLVDPGKAGMLVDWLLSSVFNSELAAVLFKERPATLSAFFVVALAAIPVCAIWGASDQLASQIANRHLRFITPRCGRSELYLGRFISSFLFLSCVSLITGIAATLVSLCIDEGGAGAILAHSLRVNLTLILYYAPYVALMSFFGVLTGVPALAAVCAYGALSTLRISVAVLTIRYPNAEWAGFLFPYPLKLTLLGGDALRAAGASALLLVYTGIYLVLGWPIFRRRNI